MIFHYLTIAIRNLASKKLFAAINIFGLSASLAACTLIFYYVYSELSFDKFHENADRIYRLQTRFDTPQGSDRMVVTFDALGPLLKKDYPEVKEFVRLGVFSEAKVRTTNELVKADNFVEADPSILKVFSVDWLAGNREEALAHRNDIVLSRAAAMRFFGNESPLGKSIHINDQQFSVSGVFADVPSNTNLRLDAIMPASFTSDATSSSNMLFNCITYVLLDDQKSADRFSEKLTAFSRKLKSAGNGPDIIFEMQPLTSLHFGEPIQMDVAKANESYLIALFLIGAVLFSVALINFVNMTTVRFMDRTYEIGVRKVIGANRAQVVRQFFTEVSLTLAISATLAVILIQSASPIYFAITNHPLLFQWDRSIPILISILAILFVVALIAIAQPAITLTRFKAVTMLKKNSALLPKSSYWPGVLLTTKIAFCTGALVMLSVIYFQIEFIQNHDPGFDGTGLLSIQLPVGDTTAFKRTAAFANGVEMISDGPVSFTGHDFLGTPLLTSEYHLHGDDGATRSIMPVFINVDRNYTSLLKIQTLEGSDFSKFSGGEAAEKVMVNQAFVRTSGWAEAIGQKVSEHGRDFEVIGVVPDFNFASLHHTVQPLIIHCADYSQPDNIPTQIHVRVPLSKMQEVRNTFNMNFPDAIFSYRWYDETNREQYKGEQILLSLFSTFGTLSVILAMLGLFATVSYHLERKQKEIGIRKIVGATYSNLLKLYSIRYLTIILAGAVLGAFIASYSADQWLQNFAFRTHAGIMLIVPVVAFILVFSFLVVFGKIFDMIKRNAVESLRHE